MSSLNAPDRRYQVEQRLITPAQGEWQWSRLAPSAMLMIVTVVGYLVVAFVALRTLRGQQVDETAFLGAKHGQSYLWRIGDHILETLSVTLVALVVLTALVIAALRRRWLLAVQTALVMGCAPLSAEVLKFHVMYRPNLLGLRRPLHNTLPSGHTTVAASVAVTALLLAPRRLRPLMALLGACFSTAVGVSTLTGQWHRPSDVVCGFMVVGFWAGVATVVAAFERPDSQPSSWWTRLVPRGYFARADDYAGTGTVAVFFLIYAVFAAVAAGWALRHTWLLMPTASASRYLYRFVNADVQVTAYLGGVAGVVAAAGALFAGVLAIRQRLGRVEKTESL